MSIKVGAEWIFGTPLTLKYIFAQQEIDNDRSGYSISGLTASDREKVKRDSDFHLVEAGFPIPLAMNVMLTPKLSYLIGDADGDANSFNCYQGQVNIEYLMDRWMFFGNVNLAKSDYDDVNPVFDKTREDTTHGAMLGVGYQAPFGWENWMVNLYTAWEERDSNIKFYDRTTSMVGIGMTWNF